jgi:heptosyltransferase-2
MATGCLEALRRALPSAHIAWMLKPGREEIVDGSGAYDELLIDDSHLGWRAFRAVVRRVRAGRFDLAILMTHSLRSAAAIWAARVPDRVGHPKGGQGILLTLAVRPERRSFRRWKPLPMPTLYARLFAAAGVDVADTWPHLAVPPATEERYRERRREFGIADGESLIGIVPGAAFGASKLWPAERIAALADRMTEGYGLRTMLFAGPAEQAIADRIRALARSAPLSALDRPLGLGLLKPFVRDLRLLVTMDTGPRHVATAFRVPTVAILGPTDPEWTNEHLDHQEIVRRELPCSPCQKPVCPLGHHRCMTEIEVGEVLARVDRLMARSAAPKEA